MWAEVGVEVGVGVVAGATMVMRSGSLWVLRSLALLGRVGGLTAGPSVVDAWLGLAAQRAGHIRRRGVIEHTVGPSRSALPRGDFLGLRIGGGEPGLLPGCRTHAVGGLGPSCAEGRQLVINLRRWTFLMCGSAAEYTWSISPVEFIKRWQAMHGNAAATDWLQEVSPAQRSTLVGSLGRAVQPGVALAAQ